jgi:hypothetical protein
MILPGQRLCAIALAAVAFSVSFAHAAAAEPRAVVELFTSQGCSSCPPADKILSELAKDSSLIALSLPVDYWDHLGWKDSLASPRHTKRQWAYSRAHGQRGVYTPQVVINGSIQVLGSDKAAIERAVAKSDMKLTAITIKPAPSGDKLTIGVPASAKFSGKAEVWLCGVASAMPVEIKRGENRGRTIVYSNVGRRWVKLGEWSGQAANFTVPVSDIRADGVDRAAVIMQGGNAEKPGAIIGAALAPLR